jgi:predicted permease
MQAVVDVVLPVFGIILAGWACGIARVLGQDSSEALNRYVYWVALPALLFVGMARVPIRAIFDVPFLAAYLLGVAGIAALAIAVARVAFPGGVAVMTLGAMSATYANTGYMGIPLFLTAYGPDGTLPAVIATVINASAMVGGAVAIIETGTHAHGLLLGLRRAAAALATNPLVVAPVAGIAASALGLPLPRALQVFCDLLGASAGPCALFAVGLFLASQSAGALVGGARAIEAGWLTVLKLVGQPALTWALARAFGLDARAAFGAAVLAGLPTGALSFVLAQKYGVYVVRSSAVILASTVLSALTLSIMMGLLAP